MGEKLFIILAASLLIFAMLSVVEALKFARHSHQHKYLKCNKKEKV